MPAKKRDHDWPTGAERPFDMWAEQVWWARWARSSFGVMLFGREAAEERVAHLFNEISRLNEMVRQLSADKAQLREDYAVRTTPGFEEQLSEIKFSEQRGQFLSDDDPKFRAEMEDGVNRIWQALNEDPTKEFRQRRCLDDPSPDEFRR